MVKDAKWNCLFISSNTPPPNSHNKCRAAIAAGKKLTLVYLQRNRVNIVANEIAGCEVFAFPVNFRAVEFSRIIALFKFGRWLRKNILPFMENSYEVYVDSVDLLFVICLLCGKNAKIKYLIRDLHVLQIENGFRPMIIRAVERFCVKRVSHLLLTCQEYYDRYYQKIYTGDYTVIENWPDHTAWNGFCRIPRASALVVGYVGIIRYMKCVKTLILAVKELRERGYDIVIKFAGGGNIEETKEIAGGEQPWIEFTGPFQYMSDIQTIYQDIDIIFSVYDPSYRNVRYAMPNKYYEAMFSGIPIVVSSGTFLAEMVKRAGIGVAVDPYRHKELTDVLEAALKHEGWFADAQKKLASLSYLSALNENEDKMRKVMGEF